MHTQQSPCARNHAVLDPGSKEKDIKTRDKKGENEQLRHFYGYYHFVSEMVTVTSAHHHFLKWP